mgnify:CR=1 FL=1
MNALTVSQVYVGMFSNYLEQIQSRYPDKHFNPIVLPTTSSSNCDRLSISSVESLVSFIAEATNNKSFGLDIGEHIHPSDYGIFGYAMMNCSTLSQAAELVVNYGSLLNQAFNVTLTEVGDNIHFQLESSSVNSASYILVELYLSSVVQLARFLAGAQNCEDVVMSEVRFKHTALTDTDKYHRVFKCPVRFNQSVNEIVVTKNVLSQNIRSASPKMFLMLLKKMMRSVDEMNHNVSFSKKVSSFVEANINDQTLPSAPIAAKHFNISMSTLKKHLHQENLNYTSICDDVRKKMAVKMLTCSSDQFQNISDYLGFSNSSAFHRAFKRWTGMTPAEYRRNSVSAQAL